MRQKHDRVQAWQTEGALACDSGYVLHEVKTRGSKSGDSCQDGDPQGISSLSLLTRKKDVTLQKQMKLPRWLIQGGASL